MDELNDDAIRFRFKACSPPNCGCPDVEFDAGLVTIHDDFGGKVKLTVSELEFIANKTSNLITLAKEDMVRRQTEKVAEIKQARG